MDSHPSAKKVNNPSKSRSVPHPRLPNKPAPQSKRPQRAEISHPGRSSSVPRILHLRVKRIHHSQVSEFSTLFLSKISSPFATIQAHSAALSTQDQSAFRSMFRAMVAGTFGAEPEILMKSPILGLSVTFGSLNAVFPCAPVYFYGWGNVTSMFDEFRFVGPVHYKFTTVKATGTSGASQIPIGIGAIDYADSTPYISIAQAYSNETSKLFALEYAINLHENGLSIAQWTARLQGQPDLAWTPIGTNSTAVCYLKTYVYTTLVGSYQAGNVHMSAPVKFRLLENS